MSEHAFTSCHLQECYENSMRPSDRDVNWRPPVQGKAHPEQVKEPYGNSNWLLVGFHLATRSVQCTPSASSWEFKKERKTVFYAIAHQNVLFFIFYIIIWIVLKHCFC